MATTTSQTGVQVKLSKGRLLAVSTPGEGAVDIVAGAYGPGSQTQRIVNSKIVFGPYGSDTVLNIRSRNGSDVVTYEDELQLVTLRAAVDPVSGKPTGILSTPDGLNMFASVPLIVTGGDQVDDVLTAKFINGTGNLQWYRQNVDTLVVTEIVGQTAATYTRAIADVGFIVSAYATSWQPMAAGRVTRANRPTAPQNVTATAGNNQVTVGFAAPASNKGSAVAGYMITRLPGGQQFGPLAANATSYVDTTAQNGTAYTYYVQAFNGIDLSPAAATAAVTPAPVTALPLDFSFVVEGDSIPAGTGSTSASLAQSIVLAFDGRMSMAFGFNQAVSGENTAQTSATAETSVINALSPTPKMIFDHTATNDIRLFPSRPVSEIIANKQVQYAAYLAAGITDHILVGLMLPCNDTAWQALTQTRKDDMALLNAAILTLASDKIHIVPIPAGFSIATHCLPDQIHLNDAGAKLYAETIWATAAPFVTSATIRARYLDARNLLLAAGNPQLTGTTGTKSGGITGEVADGWTAAGAFDGTMACVASKVADFNGSIGQRFVTSGAAATAARNYSFNRTVTFSGQAGEQFEGYVDWKLEAGHQGVRNPGLLIGISGEVSADTAGRVNTVTRTSGLATSGMLRTYYSGVLTAPRTSIVFNMAMTFDVGATVSDVTMGKPVIWKRGT